MSVEEDAVIVPEALIRAKFQSLLDPLDELLATLKHTAGRIALVGTPPPKGDNDYLRHVLPPEFSMYLNPGTATVERVRLTSPTTRLKLWYVLQEIYQESADKHGLEFIAVPHIVTDASGFLKRKYWAADVTHANRAYGRVMLNLLIEKLTL